MLYDHGTRRAYRSGCRCLRCRDANAQATRNHRAAPLGTVDASPARLHLAQLQAAGLGYRQIARLAGCASVTVRRVLAGCPQLRPATAARLLSVRPILAHGATVPGTKTHRQIDSLHREGFTRREIAFRLGSLSQQLQLHLRVRVRSALKVAQLYHHLSA